MSALRIAGLLDLVLLLLCEADGKETQQESVGRLDIDVSLDKRLPLLYHQTQLVRRQVHRVKVRQHVTALNLLGDQLELAKCHLIVLKVGERHLKYTTLQPL